MYGCMDVWGHLSSVLPLLFSVAILIFIISWVRRVSWIWIQVSLIPPPENIGYQKTWVFIRKNLLKKLFFLLVIFWFPIVKIGFSMVIGQIRGNNLFLRSTMPYILFEGVKKPYFFIRKNPSKNYFFYWYFFWFSIIKFRFFMVKLEEINFF